MTTEMEWNEKVMPELIGYWSYLSGNDVLLAQYKKHSKPYQWKDVLDVLEKVAVECKNDNLPKFVKSLRECVAVDRKSELSCSNQEYRMIMEWRSIYADGRSVQDILDLIRNGGQAVLDELDEKRCKKVRTYCERFGLCGYPYAWVLSSNGKENIDVISGERYPIPDLSGIPFNERMKAYGRYVAPYRPKKNVPVEKTVFDNVLKYPVSEEIH